MFKIFKDNGSELWSILNNINQFGASETLPSFKRSIANFNVDEIYDEILNYVDYASIYLDRLKGYFMNNLGGNFDYSIRIKSEASLLMKWDKNLLKGKQLKEVCNDIIGIRIIGSLNQNELVNQIMDNDYGKSNSIKIVNFYEKAKSIDDGYRAIHLYFQQNPKGFPIELQFWTRNDALFNFYTHDVIYKSNNKASHIIEYSRELRKWLDSMPNCPEEINLTYIDYLYEILHSSEGDE